MISTADKRILDDLRGAVKHSKERIRRLQVISKGKDSDLWKAMKEEFEQSIRTNERNRDIILSAKDVRSVEADFSLAKSYTFAIQAYKGMIANVEQSDLKIAQLNEQIAEYNQNITKLESGERPVRAREREVV